MSCVNSSINSLDLFNLLHFKSFFLLSIRYKFYYEYLKEKKKRFLNISNFFFKYIRFIFITMCSDYFNRVGEGIEFLLALGSIIGLLGIVLGLIFFIIGGSKYRWKMLGVIMVSIILVSFCGGYQMGIKYFRIH